MGGTVDWGAVMDVAKTTDGVPEDLIYHREDETPIDPLSAVPDVEGIIEHEENGVMILIAVNQWTFEAADLTFGDGPVLPTKYDKIVLGSKEYDYVDHSIDPGGLQITVRASLSGV